MPAAKSDAPFLFAAAAAAAASVVVVVVVAVVVCLLVFPPPPTTSDSPRGDQLMTFLVSHNVGKQLSSRQQTHAIQSSQNAQQHSQHQSRAPWRGDMVNAISR